MLQPWVPTLRMGCSSLISQCLIETPKPTVYYLPGTSGWSDTLGGLPTALWLPRMQQIAGGSSGSATQITFNVFWAKGRTVVIDCCNDLLNPAWNPVATNTLTSSTWSFNGS